MRSRFGWFRGFFGAKAPNDEELKRFAETVYRCTLCGSCQQVCPSSIALRELWVALRQDMVRSEAYPRNIDMIRDNLAESWNVFGEDNDERADWVDDMPDAPDHAYQKEQAEVVYFTGCVSSYFPMAQQIPMALTETLAMADVDFTLLGEEEWCCGFPLMGAGLRDRTEELIRHNLKAVRSKGASLVVFARPSCYQMWKEHYPPEFEMYHVTEYLHELIVQKRLPMKEIPMAVTYHDPCDLGRSGRVYEIPREVIRAVPGVTLVEMPRNREDCLCCGGGGNLEMIDPGLSSKIAREKVDEALSTGASAVITACQQCVRTMTTYARRNKVALEVMDVVQLIHKSLDN